MSFTRRTHIVRVPLDDPPVKGRKPTEYADVEVLDAVAFRIDNGKEVILSLDVKKSVPYIVDETGGDHGSEPSKPTQRTHMKRIISGDQKLDVEVLDCWAARDQNGEEWILDMRNSKVFDITDNTGDRLATRRAHDEIITAPSGKEKADAGDDYVTSQRSDNIAFRKARGEEVIINIPSCDDPNSPNVTFKRAATHMTPEGYNPDDDSDSATAPPLLADSDDPHVYLSHVKGAAGFLTKDEKIQMGPFWWIRKIKSGSGWIMITTRSAGSPPTIDVRDSHGSPISLLYDKTIATPPPDSKVYWVYPSPSGQQPLVWVHDRDPEPFGLWHPVPSGGTIGYDSLDDFLKAPNPPWPQVKPGFISTGLPFPGENPPSQSGSATDASGNIVPLHIEGVIPPFPYSNTGQAGQDMYDLILNPVPIGSILTPEQEAIDWVTFFNNRPIQSGAGGLAQDLEWSAGGSGNGGGEHSTGAIPPITFAYGVQDRGGTTLYGRTVIFKLQDNNFTLDLTLPDPTSGGLNGASVTVISEWPMTPVVPGPNGEEKLILPITSNDKGVFNEPAFRADWRIGSQGDGPFFGGTFDIAVTRSKDPADIISVADGGTGKEPLVLTATPPFPTNNF